MNSLKLLLLLTFTPLMACSHSQDSNDNPAYAPVINPHPQYFMTVQGYIDPAVASLLDLHILAQYQAGNGACKYTINYFEGVSAPVHRVVTFIAKPNKKGHYIIQVPLDYYFSGECQWTISSIQDEVTNNEVTPLTFALFTSSGHFPNNLKSSKSTLVVCNKQAKCYWKKIDGYEYPLPVNHNYIYRYDILKSNYDISN